MPYITRQDDISALPLSVRSLNCLRRANIHTVGALMDYPEDDLLNIRNMGTKSVEELKHWICVLSEGTEGYALVEQIDVPFKSEEVQPITEKETVFLDEKGVVAQDIAIKSTYLSARAKNSLTKGGIEFVSQLVALNREELMNLRNMGQKTVEEILNYVSKVQITYEKPNDDDSSAASFSENNEIIAEFTAAYSQTNSTWSRELLTIKNQFPEAMGETLIYRMYDSPFVRATAKTAILQLVENNSGEISHNGLIERLPEHLGNTTVLEELLLELESAMAIEVGEVMIRRQYPSIVQYVMQLKNEREREVLEGRLAGKTLQEIGDQYGITRERVRQLSQKGLKKKPYLREDKYAYIYNNYDFSEEDIFLAFDESKETYNYLEIISTNSRNKRKPIEELLTDAVISPEMRRKAERAIYKKYVTVDGVRVKKSRPDLVKHFVKTLCKSLTKYDDFFEMYHAKIDALGLSDDPSLLLDSRTYINILNGCDYVLWNQWRSFRYYNIPEHDFEDLLKTIDFEALDNTEISSLKLFRDYPELMVQYDIHDEYELHNLLKKIWKDGKVKINFKKMPTIEIGTSNREEQILSLLIQYAPISAEGLASKYEDTYGMKASSVMANYFDGLDVYYYDGVYSITSDNLPQTHFKRMKAVLTESFYTIQDIKRIYLREFPDADTTNINPYTLKTLDFRVYSGYVIKNIYPNAMDYFCSLLTTDDVVDARNISKSVQSVVAYSSELYKLRAAYEIVEFAPLRYINIRRLNAVGITTDHFENYCKAVAHNYEKGEYFTVASLRKDGFTHDLDDLGFDEWFYASVLLENRELFSYQRVGGTRLFLRGKTGANLGDMLVWLLEKYQKIDIYDLMDLLENHYGIAVPKEKLHTIISGTELYYDTIMEAVYIDYDTYFEEI